MASLITLLAVETDVDGSGADELAPFAILETYECNGGGGQTANSSGEPLFQPCNPHMTGYTRGSKWAVAVYLTSSLSKEWRIAFNIKQHQAFSHGVFQVGSLCLLVYCDPTVTSSSLCAWPLGR